MLKEVVPVLLHYPSVTIVVRRTTPPPIAFSDPRLPLPPVSPKNQWVKRARIAVATQGGKWEELSTKEKKIATVEAKAAFSVSKAAVQFSDEEK